ncbi:phage tail protein [Nocardioides sp. Root122]|uniref:phage tail protein n=1 Tax=Nocardioides TaxID=1839 RepID=UPI000702AFE4|nr:MULTISPECIES: tail fiber protein [Nocardioides]KQV67862.1 phage tail protein [Nocardioides sp. Root122]MCK9823800.1 tail fiber protein [Nocardioides cavernae]
MSGQDPFVAEIALFPFNFCPPGWAWCDGQLLPISQNTALFSLLGTFYGGDGKSNFALPNLNGRVPVGHGQGPGLSVYDLGQEGGSETVTLLPTEIPAHSHTLTGSSGTATTANPAAAVPATTEAELYHSTGQGSGPLLPTGGSAPHNNMQPYLTLYYAIALQGVYPSRG